MHVQRLLSFLFVSLSPSLSLSLSLRCRLIFLSIHSALSYLWLPLSSFTLFPLSSCTHTHTHTVNYHLGNSSFLWNAGRKNNARKEVGIHSLCHGIECWITLPLPLLQQSPFESRYCFSSRGEKEKKRKKKRMENASASVLSLSLSHSFTLSLLCESRHSLLTLYHSALEQLVVLALFLFILSRRVSRACALCECHCHEVNVRASISRAPGSGKRRMQSLYSSSPGSHETGHFSGTQETHQKKD